MGMISQVIWMMAGDGEVDIQHSQEGNDRCDDQDDDDEAVTFMLHTPQDACSRLHKTGFSHLAMKTTINNREGHSLKIDKTFK